MDWIKVKVSCAANSESKSSNSKGSTEHKGPGGRSTGKDGSGGQRGGPGPRTGTRGK